MKKEEQFNVLVSENDERIRRICRYYSKSLEDHKDIYQEVLVNIWKSMDNFRGDSAITTWVYRVAVNTALTFSGKAYRHMQLKVDWNVHNLNVMYDETTLKDKMLQEKQMAILQCELNQLSVIDKALMSLMLEGLTMREIADIIGITESNVKVKIFRVKAFLKSKLNKVHYEYV